MKKGIYSISNYLKAYLIKLAVSVLLLYSVSINSSIAVGDKEKELKSISYNRSFSLRQALDIANENNTELIAGKFHLPVTAADIKINSQFLNPRFNMEFGFGPAYTIIIAGNTQSIGFQQEVQTAGKRTKSIALAKSNYLVSQLQVAALRFDIHNRVRRMYAELAASEAYADLLITQKKLAEELYEIANKKFIEGRAPKSEVLKAKLDILEFEPKQNKAMSRLQQASTNLASIIGETPDHIEIIDATDNALFKMDIKNSDLVPSPDRTLPSISSLLELSLRQRLERKINIQQQYADQKAISIAKSMRVPNLFIESGLQYTTFLKNQPFGLFAGSVPRIFGAYLNIGAELPIFYRYIGEIEQAQAILAQDEDEITQIEHKIQGECIESYYAVKAYRDILLNYQNILIPQAASLVSESKQMYKLGKSELSDALLAKQQYQQILSSYFDTVVSYQNAWADLEKSVGVSLQL